MKIWVVVLSKVDFYDLHFIFYIYQFISKTKEYIFFGHSWLSAGWWGIMTKCTVLVQEVKLDGWVQPGILSTIEIIYSFQTHHD